MAIEFYAPEWTFAPPSPPEPAEPPSANSLSIPDEAYGASTAYAIDPTLPLGPNDWDEADRANAARVDELNNEFIDLRNGILHDGDDAFFNRTGRDAILAAPEVHAKLEAARQETLGRAANDVQREWLAETLGKHKIVEHFDIADHAGRQSVAWQKSINRGRLDRLNRQAGRDHADPKMVEALANASESSDRDHARASGHKAHSPEAQAEVDIARSSVFRHAIEGALAKGAHSTAIKLHERAKDKLVPGDAELLDKMIEAVREMEIGKAYVAKIAPLTATTNLSIDGLAKAQVEATAKNNTDWKDNDRQRNTNQHYINVQSNEAKRQVREEKAKLAQTVHDWLITPRTDGRPQTTRPPIAIWARLMPDEQKSVDAALELNADKSTMNGSNIVLAQSVPEQDDKAQDPENESHDRGQGNTSPLEGPARRARREQFRRELILADRDRALTEWFVRQGQDGKPGTDPVPAELLSNLSQSERIFIEKLQKQAVNNVQHETLPETYEKILRGLTSKNPLERQGWAREPLYHFRELLSYRDYATLTMLQRNLSPYDGNPRSGVVGNPIGTLDDHVDLAIRLSILRGLPYVYGILRKGGDKLLERLSKAPEGSTTVAPPSTSAPQPSSDPEQLAIELAIKALLDGLKNLMRDDVPPTGPVPPSVEAPLHGFSPTESRIVEELKKIYESPQMDVLRKAHAEKRAIQVEIEGQLILYEPDAPVEGMTVDGALLIGPKAFVSEREIARTIGHELYRLRTGQTGVDAQHVRRATDLSQDFGNRAGDYVIGGPK